ncbi:DUF2141 domain-containing protein [Sphingomonas crusticola]|uniref:DUF2141 domain-containing protein n=1 Tax=Sphingomonas crusticola TaxID=1697973 RepID=UPI000E2573FC|nr:DUF2141 domain-containing protein [Sphingomonas crusticola]
MRRWLLLLPLLIGNAAAGGPIEVDVSGLRSAQGFVRVSVCPKNLFLKVCPWSASVPAHAGEVKVVVEGVPPGQYAVQAFHDADADNKLGQNWIGIPREGIGFSNDAMGHLTLPRFSVAAFDHGPARQRIAVTVRYFLG